MSRIEEFANIPETDITGGETLEQAIEDCRNTYAKYDKEINGNGSEYSLARCNSANLVLLTMAHRSHHVMEYVNARARAQMLADSTGADLDQLALSVGIQRLPAGRATTVIRFTLAAQQPGATSIPEGTQVKTSGNVYFRTAEYAEIAAGELSVDVSAIAAEAGAGSTGIPKGSINILVDPIPYVKQAENTVESSGGTDQENDDSLTRRVYLAPSVYSVAGPKDAYEYFVSAWRTDVTDKYVDCEEGYTVHIYFLMEDGRLPNEAECRALEEYFKGIKKPMGDLVAGHAPEEVEYNIGLTYYIGAKDAKSVTTIQTNVNAAVDAYVQWQRKIGRDIDSSELIMRVRAAGAKRPTLTAPENTVVTNTQVAKLVSKNVTYGGMEDD